MKVLVTTVGISLFENYLKKNKQLLEKYPDFIKESPSFSKKWRDSKEYILGFDGKSNWWKKVKSARFFQKFVLGEGVSAEISSILKILEETEKEKFCIHLIASDTVLSVAAAMFIKEWFNQDAIRQQFPQIVDVKFDLPKLPFSEQQEEQHVALNLCVTNDENFRKGFINLFEILNEISRQIWEENQAGKDKNSMVLNITSGYKAIAPALTMYGQLYKIPVKYIYDENELDKPQLITMGSLPFSFDWDVVEGLADLLEKEKIEDIKNQKLPIFNELLKLNICREKNGQIELTVLADLLLNYINFKSSLNRGILGVYLEYQLFYYFSQKDTGENYWNPAKINQERLFYDPKEEKFKEKEGKGYHKIGDLDLMIQLKAPSIQSAICEVKSLNKFKAGIADQQTNRNYFDKQIKPRIIHYREKFNVTEFHFYIYCVSFSGSNKSLVEDEALMKQVNYFNKRINEDEKTKGITLRVRGFQVDLSKSGIINYAALLGKPFDKIDWEDIYQGNLPTLQIK